MPLTEDEWMARHIAEHPHRRTMREAIDEAGELSLSDWCDLTHDDPTALVRALEDLEDLYTFPCTDEAEDFDWAKLAKRIDW